MADRPGAQRSSTFPRGGRYFASREAYGITYQSCQESGKFNGLFRLLAANMGTDEAFIRRALKRL